MINYRYNILKKLDAGRSNVYLSEDRYNNDKLVALKFLKKNYSNYEKLLFDNEYKILKKLNHSSIVKSYSKEIIYHSDESNFENEFETGQTFISLEYINGNNLNTILYSFKEENEITNIISQIALTLFYLHNSNYYYFDLKPENILVTSNNNDINIKLIDFGLAHFSIDKIDNTLRGTAMYMAPEILRNSKIIDNRIDFYSLGIILYQLIYGKKPFDGNNELSVFKSHIESLFVFESNNYSYRINSVLHKLLEKEPSNRYSNGLEIIDDLQIYNTTNIINNWNPPEIFIKRKIYKEILDIDNNILMIIGENEIGKTTLLKYINENNNESFLFSRLNFIDSFPLWINILRIIIENENIYYKINVNDRLLWENIRDQKITSIKENFIYLLSKVVEIKKCLFLFDDIDTYDEFTKTLIEEIIPIIIINGSKVILTGEKEYKLNFKYNIYYLSHFNENEIKEYFDLQYDKYFPAKEAKELFLKRGHLLPGNINKTIKDMFLIGVLSIKNNKIVYDYDIEMNKLFIESNNQLYYNKIKSLSTKEINIINCISLFPKGVSLFILKIILNSYEYELIYLLKGLVSNNILKETNYFYQFISSNLYNIVYESIKEKEKYHYNIALILTDKSENISNVEIARQYELGKDFEKAYSFLVNEYFTAIEYSAFQYAKNILLLSESYILPDILYKDYIFNLAKINFMLGDYNAVLNNVKIIEKIIPSTDFDKIIILKGTALIELGKNNDGKELLSNYLIDNKNEEYLTKIYFYFGLAEYAELNYVKATEYLATVINSKNEIDELTGRAYNLLGLIELNNNNNYSAAITYFKKSLIIYRNAKLKLKIAQAEMNIGNVLNIIGKNNEAIESWNRSLEINKSIGNLEQEAKLLINFGIAQYNRCECENAILKYERAASILSTMNNVKGLSLVLINKAEAYLRMCEYNNAINSVLKAENLLSLIVDPNEYFELLIVKSIIYYELCEINQLSDTIEKQNKLFQKLNFNQDDYVKNNFVKLLLNYLETDNINVNELENYILHFIQNENLFLFHTAFDTLASFYQNKNDDSSLLKLIENISSKTKKSNNIYTEALINYFLFVQLLVNNKNEMNKALEKLNVSYKLLEDVSINTLILRIIVNLYKIYNERGNINKAKEYFLLAGQIIEFVNKSIDNNDLRNSFVYHPYFVSIYDELLNLYS